MRLGLFVEEQQYRFPRQPAASGDGDDLPRGIIGPVSGHGRGGTVEEEGGVQDLVVAVCPARNECLVRLGNFGERIGGAVQQKPVDGVGKDPRQFGSLHDPRVEEGRAGRRLKRRIEKIEARREMDQPVEDRIVGIEDFHRVLFVAADQLDLAVRQHAQHGQGAGDAHRVVDEEESHRLGVENFRRVEGGAIRSDSAGDEDLPARQQHGAMEEPGYAHQGVRRDKTIRRGIVDFRVSCGITAG